ncbi:hypothetical protein FRB95_007163 [Tulasnella sp. JGI-2019a]|nr:hypothetical protein FRB95_007163 [Tulasnella sp. JGI-2019a]
MNITMTWYLTGFIVCRLWSSERRARAAEDYEISSRSGLYNRIIKVLIQSGMLHSVTEAIFLLCIIVGSDNGIAFMSDVEARIIGIVTTLIVLQLNRSGVITIPRWSRSARRETIMAALAHKLSTPIAGKTK